MVDVYFGVVPGACMIQEVILHGFVNWLKSVSCCKMTDQLFILLVEKGSHSRVCE